MHHTSTQTEPCLVMSFEDDLEAEHISEIVKQIPDVLEYLQSAGKSQMYQKFTSLLTERKQPLSNIAFLFLCDVVEWYSIGSTRDIRCCINWTLTFKSHCKNVHIYTC